MNVRKINYSYKYFTRAKACMALVVVLTVVLLWQFAMIARKSQTISNLMSENADLKKSLTIIDDQLLSLNDTASDVRLFQREMIRVIRNLDQSYPVSFAKFGKTKPALGNNVDKLNTETILTNATESIFKLSSTHDNLRFETASLLGRAISIKEILDNTPSLIPVNGRSISSDFGMRVDPFTGRMRRHNGIDIPASIGTPVFASADGRVIFAGKNIDLGNLVELSHANGFVTNYGHLSEISIKKGDVVKRGQIIGLVGNTGRRCAGAHLHYGVKRYGKNEDPKPFLIGSPPTIF